MDVKQIASLMNEITKEILGTENLVKEDLSNIVDIGSEIFNANAYDNYVRKLVDRIGKTIFVNRPYNGKFKDILRDSWEYGSILQKVQADLPECEETEDWKLVDRASYDPNIFYQPKISVKFFNSKTTFTIPMSFTEMQVKESLSSPSELNGFISLIENSIDKSMTLKTEALIKRTINNFIAETIYNEFPSAVYNNSTGVRAINLLYEYNQGPNAGGTPLAKADALYDKEFLRFASQKIKLVMTRLTDMSTLYNVGGKTRFTPKDLQHVWLLNNFTSAIDMYLESDTFHNELVALPKFEEISYFQGTGTDYEMTSTSKIHVTTASGHDVQIDGILGVIFDHEACAVCHEDKRTRDNYNPRAEFYTKFTKWDAEYLNDMNENGVVFFIQ